MQGCKLRAEGDGREMLRKTLPNIPYRAHFETRQIFFWLFKTLRMNVPSIIEEANCIPTQMIRGYKIIFYIIPYIYKLFSWI